MAHETSQNTETGKPGLANGLGLVEKAWDAVWAFRILWVVLFLDIASNTSGGYGILDWSSASDPMLRSPAFWIEATTGFCLFAAIIFPLSGHLFEQLFWRLLWRLSGAGNDDLCRCPGLGYVLAHTLEKRAIRDKDEFMLARYEKSFREREERIESTNRLSNFMLGAWVLAVIDYSIAWLKPGSQPLVHSFIEVVNVEWSLVVATLLTLVTIEMWSSAFLASVRSHWIYYPPLADELDAENRKKRMKMDSPYFGA